MILEEEVEKIRAVRQRIWARWAHDPKRLLEHYRQVSEQLRASGRVRFAETERNESVLTLRDTPAGGAA
ncbi:MAG: hypothetical protein FJ387_29365 [Verrucomicrobia bacterium]|nr:hypothetical protein [Verrucomicrobiota bacterium]